MDAGAFFARYERPLSLTWIQHGNNSTLQHPLNIDNATWCDHPTPQAPVICVISPAQQSRLLPCLAHWQQHNILPLILLFSGEALIPSELLQDHHVHIMHTSRSDIELLRYLNQDLAEQFSPHEYLHGVLMRMFDQGVLLTGDPGIGKSELALALISQGHRLIADDAPLFYRTGHQRLLGVCPPLLANMLEVRGLGIVDIKGIYGDNAVSACTSLDLIIRLKNLTNSTQRYLKLPQKYRKIAGVNVPELEMEISPTRNLPLLVETLVRQFRLQQSGHDACTEFIARHNTQLEKATP